LISFEGVQKESAGQKIRTAARRNIPGKKFVIELENGPISSDASGATGVECIRSTFLNHCQTFHPGTIKNAGIVEANHDA